VIALLTQGINLFAAILLLLAFAMITQRRILSLVHLFTAQGATLVAATLDVGYLTAQHHLYLSAAATFALKVVLLPILLHRLTERLQVRWDVEPLLNTPMTMLVGILLVVFAFNLASPIAALSSSIARSTLGIALACVLLSFLMMITRAKAVPQVIGFLSMENSLFFAATRRHQRHADAGRARHRAGRSDGFPDPGRVHVPDPRAVRQPGHPAPRASARGLTMLPLTLLLCLPILGAALLGAIGHRDIGAEINVVVCAATTVCALWLAADVARGASILMFNELFFIDPLNVFLVTLTAFVGLTTSIFSRPYMRIERDHGRMTAPRMRLSTRCISCSWP